MTAAGCEQAVEARMMPRASPHVTSSEEIVLDLTYGDINDDSVHL